MPELSRFYGLVISMYHNDHGVPHLHVRYAEYFATIEVESEFVNGELPRRVRSIAIEWARVHRAELLDNWSRAPHAVVRFRIDPLEQTNMYYNVLEARYVSEFRIWLRFRDGLTGEIDLQYDLNGPVFEPLHDVEFFRQFEVHPEFETLVWPNGADMAPEFLYENARAMAELSLIP